MRILLAGTHRCGSTWVANVLGRAPGMYNVYEPDSPFTDILGTVSSHRLGEYPALRPGDGSSWYSMVWDVAFTGGWPWSRWASARRVGRSLVYVPAPLRDYSVATLARSVAAFRPRPQHVLVKSANCGLSLEWVVQQYRPRVVVQHRNPLNVVSSWMALNIPSDATLAEPGIVREHWLEPLGVPMLPRTASEVARVAWTVGVLMVGLKAATERHPDWIVISHDQLCVDPKPGFESLFKQLGLPWTEEADSYLASTDQPGFVVKGADPRSHPNERAGTDAGQSRRLQQGSVYQRRLSAADIAEARAVLVDLPLGDWAPPENGV